MKKYLSVFALFVRHSLHQVLLILLLMTAAESGLFYSQYCRMAASAEAGIPDPEPVLSASGIFFCFAGALLLISAVLCRPGCTFHEKPGYTLQRLSITEKEVFLMQGLYNTAVYGILLLTQALVCFGLCRWYIALAPSAFVSNQTVFLAFYRSGFLHALLPLAEAALWVRNFFMLTALGFATAHFPFLQRRKSFALSTVPMLLLTVAFFSREHSPIGRYANIVLMIFASCCVLGAVFYSVYKKEAPGHA